MREKLSILNSLLGETIVTTGFTINVPDDVDFDNMYNQLSKMIDDSTDDSSIPLDMLYWACSCEVIRNISLANRIKDVQIEPFPDERIILLSVTFWTDDVRPKFTYTGKHDILQPNSSKVQDSKLKLSNVKIIDIYEQPLPLFDDEDSILKQFAN